MQWVKGKGWVHLSRGICHGYLLISTGPNATDIRIVPNATDIRLYPSGLYPCLCHGIQAYICGIGTIIV